MKVQTAKRMLRLREWASQIDACRQSGKSVIKWCGEHDINVKTFYNRARVVREEMLELIETGKTNWVPGVIKEDAVNAAMDSNRSTCAGRDYYHDNTEKPVFAVLPMPQTRVAPMTVRLGEYIVDIQNGADSAMVDQVLRVVAQL